MCKFTQGGSALRQKNINQLTISLNDGITAILNPRNKTKRKKKQQQKHRISLKSFRESGHCWF
jgi:hypothetical protein